MFRLILLLFAAFFVVFGVVILRRLRQPTCRICLFRSTCPNRESECYDPSKKTCWSREQTIEGVEPAPNSRS
jgi:hypothetical protein